MFVRSPWFARLTFLAAAMAAWAGDVRAQDQSLDAYKILRSLQFVQDSLVRGDHSAADLQRYLLDSLDSRLRTAENSSLADTRNADAVFIYVMSGGNPATLNFLAARDTQGYLDARVVNVLQKYLDGRGAQVSNSLAGLADEYEGSAIGPYLNLVAGNVVYAANPGQALTFYDRTRLDAPGTILEEAALRRSIVAAVALKDSERAFGYSVRYARRFLHSPYAGQFADLFVDLAVTGQPAIGTDRVAEVAELMDADRAQELYLRISRLATLKGKYDLASFAAERANKLNAVLDGKGMAVLPGLYEQISKVSSSNVSEVIGDLAAIPRDGLSDRDKALLDAAQRIGEEIVKPVAMPPSSGDDINAQASGAHDAPAAGTVAKAAGPVPSGVPPAPASAAGPAAIAAKGAAPVAAKGPDAAVDDFVAQGKNKLGEIDSLLAKEDGDK
ncbi:chemotaxis protein [Neorhizobium sp. NCHU2750]|uniref:chemotaxis protein n=1 Tax=Neorhizobium sp. NCHU2750 TaxID=1825976 RepID=UPI000E712729|nr:chemotaxis protein [Neorhizobium sp. NCHU2750]